MSRTLEEIAEELYSQSYRQGWPPLTTESALVLLREVREGALREAAREVNAVKQAMALARDRAKAAGRSLVSECRQSDVETCEGIAGRLLALLPRSSPTHRCKACGALWILNPPSTVQPDGSWSLWSKACGKCCDNVPMGEQIEALASRPSSEAEPAGTLTEPPPGGADFWKFDTVGDYPEPAPESEECGAETVSGRCWLDAGHPGEHDDRLLCLEPAPRTVEDR